MSPEDADESNPVAKKSGESNTTRITAKDFQGPEELEESRESLPATQAVVDLSNPDRPPEKSQNGRGRCDVALRLRAGSGEESTS